MAADEPKEPFTKWEISDTHRGIQGIPIKKPGMNVDHLKINSLMVFGYNENEIADNEDELVVAGVEDSKFALERSMDFFFGMIRTYTKYLDKCTAVYERVKNSEGVTDQMMDAIIGSPQLNTETGRALEALQEKESGEASKLDPELYTKKMCEMCRDSQDLLQVVGEIIPQLNSDRGVYRTRFWAAIVGKKNVPACVRETRKDWTDVLRMILEENKQRVRDEAEKPNFKRQKATPKESLVDEMMRPESDRRLHTDDYFLATKDWVNVATGHINQNNSDELDAWQSYEAEQILIGKNRTDRTNHAYGPWDARMAPDNPLYSTQVCDVFSYVNELGRRPSHTVSQLPPKYTEQLDDILYIRDIFCPADEEVPDEEERQRILREGNFNSLHPYYHETSNGISFQHLPDFVQRECLFQLDLDHFSTRYAHLKKSSLGHWWSKVDPHQRSSYLTHTDALHRSKAGLSNPFVRNQEKLDQPMQLSKVQRNVNKNNQNNKFGMKPLDTMVTPMHHMHNNARQIYNNNLDVLERLRDGQTHLKYSPPYVQFRNTAHKLLNNVSMSKHTCDGTKAMCMATKCKKLGFLGDRSILKRRVFNQCRAPDMEDADNALQERLLQYEQLDISTVHAPMDLMHTAALDTMQPHVKLYLNGCCHGFGETGKDTMVAKLEKWCLVAGTIVVMGHSSACADLEYGPSIYHCMHVHDEALDNIVQKKGQTQEVGVKALSIEKRKHTENVTDSRTLYHVDGIKTTIRIKRGYYVATWYICNLESMDNLPAAFRTRLMMLPIPMMQRIGRGAAEKNAWSTMQLTDKDQLKDDIRNYFQQMQCFVFKYGTLIEFGCLMQPEMTSFVLVVKQVNDALRHLSLNLSARTIERAKILARVRTYEAIFYREFYRPHGRHSGGKSVSVETLLDSQHSFEMEMITSEAIARGAMRSVLGHCRAGAIGKIAKAFVHLIKQGTSQYSKMFVVANSTREYQRGGGHHGGQHGNGGYGDHGEPEDTQNSINCTVDLDYIQFKVAKDATGMRTFAIQLSDALMQATKSSITPSQIEDALYNITKMGEITHKTLDVHLAVPPSAVEEEWMQHTDFTLEGWRQYCLERGKPFIVDPVWLDETKKLWKQTGSNVGSNAGNKFSTLYWPTETDTGREKSLRVFDSDNWIRTGVVKISTVFLTRACSNDFSHEFDHKLKEALNMSYTTERVIARPPVDMLDVDPNAPYLVFTERAQHGSTHTGIVNQDYIPPRDWSSRYGDTKRSQFRQEPVIWLKPNVPLDTQSAVSRLKEAMGIYPYLVPSAHQLFKMDPTGLCARFGPHVLDEMLKGDTNFSQIVDFPRGSPAHQMAQRKEAIVCWLQANYQDFMRHQYDGVNLHDDDFKLTPVSTAREAYEEYTLACAHRIMELSFARRMGDIRRNALVNPDISTQSREIDAVKRVLELLQANNGDIENEEANEDEDPVYKEVLERLRYVTEKEAKEQLKLLEAAKTDSTRLRKVANTGAGTNNKGEFSSFIDEWRSLKKPKVHSGQGYVRYVRRESNALLKAHFEQDAHWMQVKNACEETRVV